MVTSTYQNLVRNILALVLGTLKIFTHATRKCRLKGKIVLCGGGGPRNSDIFRHRGEGGSRKLGRPNFLFRKKNFFTF